MNAPDRIRDWGEANQRVLVAEFACLKARLVAQDEAPARSALAAERARLALPAAIDTLAESFALSRFERDVVLLLAGVEMDLQLATLCGAAQDAPQRPWATFSLAMAVIEGAHWSALAPVAPLRRWQLVVVDEGSPLVTARLSLDERVLHFLAGIDMIDARIEPMLRSVRDPTLMTPLHDRLCRGLYARLDAAGAPLPLVQLVGSDASVREDIAARCAALMGAGLHAIDAGHLPHDASQIAMLATLWQRESSLRACGLLIECGDEPPTPAALQFADRVGGLVFLATPQPASVHRTSFEQRVERPDAGEQRWLWEQALGDAAPRMDGEIGAVASQFRFGTRRAVETARNLRAQEAAPTDAATPSLWNACRAASPGRLAELAESIEARAQWDELVLPAPQKQTLMQMAVHMRRREQVHGDWGFGKRSARGLGITALFAGESGTGKTLAAEALAQSLGLDLFRIDLSAVVSKYIGETEKNLRRVFDAAEESGAMLLFDEADALFGKRSEVKDSHDRYANIEVSYLLQRMESYRGMAILTTNHKAALDAAFMRRLRFVVHFPFPESAEREAIWRNAFPAATPTRELDFRKLARLQVAGGQINNIALGAAFLAAEQGEPVGMAQLLQAARVESAKRERTLTDAETRDWL